MKPEEIQTEVFLLPCCSSVEKEGSISNSSRLAQWRYKAIEPLGQSLSDAEILNELHFKVKALYKKEKGAFPDPILKLTWEYGEKDKQGKVKHLDVQEVAQGDQRVLPRGRLRQEGRPAEADRQEGRPGHELRQPAGRRLDLERELALLRQLLPEGRQGRQHDGPQGQGRPDRPRPLPELGLGVAAEPADHLQPGLRGPEREPLGPEARGDHVETRRTRQPASRARGKATSPTGRPRRWRTRRTGSCRSS